MKKFTPFVVPLAVIVGLFTMMFSANHLMNEVKLDFGDIGKKHEIKINQIDSISVTKKAENIILNQRVKNDLYGKNISKIEINKLSLNRHPAILNWITFHSIVLALASTFIIFIFILINNLKNDFNLKFKSKKVLNHIFIPIIILIIIVVTTYYIVKINEPRKNLMTGVEMMKYFNIIFKNPKEATRFILIPLTILGVIPLIGIVMINIVTNITFNSVSKKYTLQEKYNTLKNYLNIFAFYIGLLVASTIIGTSLQRDMIAEQINNIDKIYPDEFIYTYGIAYTFILAFFFIPALINLKYFKQKNNIDIKEKDNNVNWWNIGEETISDIKLVFSIILPLLTSLFQMFK